MSSEKKKLNDVGDFLTYHGNLDTALTIIIIIIIILIIQRIVLL
jgi:hypothetical protein